MKSQTDNPYQAPQTQEYQEPTLSDDTEFLISRGEILCRETVELPRVCIQTGTTEDLVQRQQTYRVPRYRISGPVIGAAVLLLMFVGARWGAAVLVGIVCTMLTASVLMGHVHQLGMVKVSATWYVASDYLRRCRRQEWWIRAFILALTSGLGILVASSGSSPGLSHMTWNVLTGLGIGLVCGIPSLFLGVERTITCSGRRNRGPHKGLYSLRGHSRQFTKAVELIIQGRF